MLNTFLEEVALVPADQVDSSRLGLRLSPDDMADFQARLRSLLDEFAQYPDEPSAPAWSLFVTLHPDPNRPENGTKTADLTLCPDSARRPAHHIQEASGDTKRILGNCHVE